MQGRAQLVIIGAGIVGCSAAYHLSKLGWRDIVVIEQGPLFETGGSTSHAPGGVFQTNFSKMMTHLAQYTVELYCGLELDGQPCFHQVGSLEVAATEDRWDDLARKVGVAKSWGVEGRRIGAEEARALLPLLDPGQIHGAFHVPGDGIAKPVRAAEAMAAAAKAYGAVFYGETAVTGVEVKGGRVGAVQTAKGRIATEQVLLCAGIWGPVIGRMAGVSVPLAPVQHIYTITEPLAALAGESREVVHPVLRHQDRAMYFRQHADCYGIGSYLHEPLVVEPEAIPGSSAAKRDAAVMAFTPEHFAAAHRAACQLLPAVQGAALPYQINGIFSFTPDGMPLIGPAAVEGFWVAEAVWITHAGGVGKAVAEWMVQGTPGLDLREADINRFAPHAHTRDYVRARGAQQYREVYDIIHPQQQMEGPRPIRTSPFYQRQEQLGAVFFESAGWERPQWFEANGGLGPDAGPGRSGWAGQYWSPIQGREHLGTRQGVALCDLSPLAKIEVEGPGALDYLQYLAANQIDRPVGSVVYTSMLNSRGGIHCDLTVVRLAAARFWVLSGGATAGRDLAWLRQHLPSDGSVRLTDMSAQYCSLGLWGPLARAVLQQVCEEDVSNRAFPYYRARRLALGLVPALAVRLSYVGELGWELYTSVEYGLKLWDMLWEAGRAHGIFALGGGAFDSLRLEKGYRLWGADIHTEYNPFEAGLGWAVKFDKGDFLGRQALLQSRDQGIMRRLCCLTLDDPEAVVLGKEPILDGEQVLGYITSANRGYSVGQYMGYGYLPVESAVEGTQVEIEYFGTRYGATVRREPLYDPAGKKLKT